MKFPIVAIGASAGGLDAISELLTALPSRSGMAYIVVQHLGPDHESLLSEILSRKTAMPVLRVQHGMEVEPDHVYVIPPNVTLTLLDERLQLTPRAAGTGRHMPADVMFNSLAEERADNAIGVILSGSDSDGTYGVEAIKHRGGITFAQEPASAKFPSMPYNAIETGCIDFVLRPSQIAHELVRLGRHPYLRANPVPERHADDAAVAPNAPEEESLRRIFRRLRMAHGVDFTHYKRSTLRRRLARRMALRKIEDPADYVALVESDATEAATLYHDFLIRVTGFFRDPESFEGLRERVFPALCEGRSAKEPVRIWVPGCASGEEVYSIAIALMEYLGERLAPAGIQIFGTDVSEPAMEKARTGIYLDAITQEVSAERLQRFFVKQDHHYRIAKTIRDLCIFARQDVTRDPPFSRLDLVSCRNLLIYLDAAAQRRVMQIFHYALQPQGFLMLGPAESVGQASGLFDLADKHHRLFTRRTVSLGAGIDFARRAGAPYSRPREAAEGDAAIAVEADSAQRDADRWLLARYAPAGLLVDDALNILQFRGETGRYLEHASGPPSLNLHRVARPELLVEIAPAIQEARETGSETRREGLHVDDRRDVSIEVIPLKRLSTERCYLILFDDGARQPTGRHAQPVAASVLPESEKDRRLAQMGREIGAIRDYLQATMEEHEAVKEELKSAHEEVLSANEEFQSTNEELETSKEELQSANEELTTTNEELRNRNRELAVLNAEVEKARAASEAAREYADAIVETVREPLLVLDDGLKVLRANQGYYAAYKAQREDTEGHLFHEVGGGLWDVPLLREKLETVLRGNEPMLNSEVSHVFPTIGRRLMSLNASKIPGDGGRAELILLGIDDITERRANMDKLREGSRRKDEFLAMLAHELRNPLAPISNAAQLLLRTSVGDPARKLHEMIERQTRRLVRLVDELLDVARISRGVIELKREGVDLLVIARHAAEACRDRIEQREHALSLTLPDIPVWVHGDPVRLEQVVSNLLDNAAKYTNPGGKISLTLAQMDGEAVLSVSDNGIGLAADAVERIFDLFTQIDRSLVRTGGGLGLGLTLVRRILELHGGRIDARSAGLGEGSEFVVRLPVLASMHGVFAPDNRAEPDSLAAAARTRRILIIDDNEDSAESMALLARSWRHEVAVAYDGLSALELAESFRPECALVDIGLPGMDGYELAQRLRADPQHRDVQLVAMTGYGRTEDRDAALAAGFDFHLVKPAEVGELRRLLAGDGLKSKD